MIDRPKVLVVDDDPGVCETLSDILLLEGYEVFLADSGMKAEEHVERQVMDVALLDIKLPDMDGTTLLAKLKRAGPEMVCAFITGHASTKNAVAALKLGADGYFVKPLVMDEVLHFIEKALEKKRLERKINELAYKYTSLVESSVDAIISVDSEERVVQLNKAAVNIFGYSESELINQPVAKLIPVRKLAEYRSNYMKHIEAELPVEVIGVKKNGAELPLEISLGQWKTEDGQFYTGILRNIKLRKELQEKLDHAQKMETIGTLAGGIAHDFNNILAIILGYADLSKDDAPAGSVLNGNLEQILNAGYRARELVKQILAFSRQSEMERIPLYPAIIIRESIKLLMSSIPTTIEISHHIDPECGVVHIDPTELQQILMNLCTNAFHAMEETGGTLHISLENKDLDDRDLSLEPELSAGPYVMLTVKDTGSGISPDIMERIFDPYFTTKEMGKGTGMGLAIVHGIISSNGGTIQIDTEPGKGTVFRVCLPIVDKEVDPIKETTKPLPTGQEQILFIDDDPLMADMGKHMLELLGYDVTVRKNSIEALQTFQNQPERFDLVITDQTMPGMTGVDLAKRMMQIRPGIPIILCTGYSSTISEEKAKVMGIREFAMKPLLRKEIAALIRKVLDG